jgi:hypothetical protein
MPLRARRPDSSETTSRTCAQLHFHDSLFFNMKVLAYTLIGAMAAALAGYLLGALIGAGMTWHNNNVLTDAPQGSYIFWANFMGYMTAIFTWPLGIIFGLVYGLRRKASRTI